MKSGKHFSRRGFFKASAMASTFMIGGASVTSCSPDGGDDVREAFPVFHHPKYNPDMGPAGLLFSQIGYEAGHPVRVLVRLPSEELLGQGAMCTLRPVGKGRSYSVDVMYWGKIWGSHWWTAEFPAIGENGEWAVEVTENGESRIMAGGLRVGKNILWDAALPWAAVDMLERRKHFTKVGAGWQDAGTLWVESCAQSAMIIGLEDLLELHNGRLGDAFIQRIYTQLIIGCDYLVMTAAKAEELGYPKGAMSHDLLGHEKDVLPNDAVKAVIALYRAARMLPGKYAEKKKLYSHTATLTLDWLLNKAKPMGSYGFSFSQRGLSPDTVVPDDEFQTRDLLAMCWAALEKWKTEGRKEADKKVCVDLAGKVMSRQITEENAENGFYGHFLEYSSMAQSEKSWCHCIVGVDFGSDIGGIYPNYLIPFLEMLSLWDEHPDAKRWKASLESFVKGFLVPACLANPFFIVPLGIFGDEGPIWFAGPFHGSNTIYGYTAALSLELAKLFDEPKLTDIAYGNLLWPAGLNAGITRENLKACVIFSTDVPVGAALPASMMCDVGNRSAGTWFGTRGVICNGFSTGEQFKMDTEPINANDGPNSFTDEDWIPHSAAWISGLVRL